MAEWFGQKYASAAIGQSKQAQLLAVGITVEQSGVLELVLAVGAQRNELGQFQGQVKVRRLFAVARPFGKIAQRHGPADAIGELVHVAQPAADLCAVKAERLVQALVKVAGGNYFRAFFAFKNFNCCCHKCSRFADSGTKINKLFVIEKYFLKNVLK